MGTEIDRLEVQVEAQAARANSQLDNLVSKLDKVSGALSHLNSGGLTGLSKGVNQFAQASAQLSNVKTSDFTRLTKNVEKLSALNTQQIYGAAAAMTTISKAMNSLESVVVNSEQIAQVGDLAKYVSKLSGINAESVGKAATAVNRFVNAIAKIDESKITGSVEHIGELTKGIAQLGYKSSTRAIENIPKLATAMKQLMKELSDAPQVSQNVIQMTNALAKLARTGKSSGRAVSSLSKSFDIFTASAKRASSYSVSLLPSLGRLYAVFQSFRSLGNTITLASDLAEVQNVVDVTYGKYKDVIEDFASTSIMNYGMSELTTKQVASRFQAMGTAMGFAQGKMTDMSIELTKLTGDMASFYNVEQDAMATSLQAIFTGETEPLRKYGLDLTQATLAEWAMKQGLDANISSMSQMEKTMLRYQYVMANTGAAQGDFLRTQDTWANQTRILRQNLEQLAAIIGGTLINALKPFVKALNAAMSHIIAFAQTVSDALGKIFGWKYEVGGGGITTDLEDASDYADGVSSGIEDAVKNAKKLRQQLQGFDALNVLTTNLDSTNTSGIGGSSSGIGSGSANGGQWTETESIFEEFESKIDNLFELGNYVRDSLISVMDSIDWETVYEKARGFGTGLADFLNGLFAYDGEGKTLFGTVGKTLANTLNTIVYAALEFAKEFDWHQFGVNLADGLNNFFQNFDFTALAETLNEWVDGLEEAVRGFVETLTWEDIISGISDFLGTLELDTVGVIIGSFLAKNTAKNLLELLKSAILAKLSFLTNPINIPNLLIAFGKISFLLPVMVGQVGILIGDLLNHSFLDPREWDNWFGEFSRKLNEIVNDAIDWLGENVILKLFEWIAEKLSESIEEFKNVFNWEDTFDFFEISGISFDKAKQAFEEKDWGELGKNILLGVIDGLAGAISFITEPIDNFFIELWKNICEVFGIHSPAENMKPLGENILLGVVEGFAGAFETIKHAIENLKLIFQNKFIEIKNTVLNIVSNIVSNITSKINYALALFDLFESKNKSTMLGTGLKVATLVGGSIKLPTYSTGGFPEDGLFMANHGELVGKFSNGRTAVANNEQIVDGIANGVRDANAEQNALLREQNQLLRAILEKEGITDDAIFRSVQSSAESYYKMTGNRAFA